MAQLSSEGDSENWNKYKTNVLSCYERFRSHDESLNLLPWEQLPESTVCDRKIYNQFAHYLINTHLIEEGHKNAENHLAVDTALDYLNCLINMGRVRFAETRNASKDAKYFMTCLNPKASTPDSIWLQGLRRNMRATVMARVARGEQLSDQSVPPLYPHDTKEVNLAYSRKDGKDAAVRKHAVLTCQQCCGRAGETSLLSYFAMQWDSHFQAIFVTCAQPKTLKDKLAMLHAGRNRWDDWFLNYADMLVTSLLRTRENYVFEELMDSQKPGRLLTRYLQAVVEGAPDARVNFKDVWVQMCFDPAAGGLRPGCVNACYAVMPVEFVLPFSGHSLKDLTALGEYIDAVRALLIPSALCMAGYPPRPYGTIGLGPRPACLESLVEIGVDSTELDRAVIEIFHIDSEYPKQLQLNGDLWPALRCALASLIMYYPERREHREMVSVQLALQATVRTVFGCATPDVRLNEWAAVIRTQFDVDNLQNLVPQSDSDVSALSHVVQGLARTVAQQSSLQDKMCVHLTQMATKMDGIDTKVDGLHALLSSSSLQSPPQPRSSSKLQSPPHESISSPVASASGSSLVSSSPSVLPGALDLLDSHTSLSMPAPYCLTGQTCAEFYFEYFTSHFIMPAFQTKAGKPCGASKGRAEKLVAWFEAMMTETEYQFTRSPNAEHGAVRALIEKIQDLVAARIVAHYREYAMEQSLPSSLKPGKKSGTGMKGRIKLVPTALEDRLREIKEMATRNKMTYRKLMITREAFQIFRTSHSLSSSCESSSAQSSSAQKRPRTD